jgi:hypothetical protein
MPDIPNNAILQSPVITQITLNGTDTFTYRPNERQKLVLRNPTGGTITPVIIGAGAGTIYVPGVGVFSLSAGTSIAMAAGTVVTVSLDEINEWLVGACSITAGTGLVAYIVAP